MANIQPPEKAERLIFLHHSCGENWLMDDNGGLAIALAKNNYFISDTNYGWGPDAIGDKTYTGEWWTWFKGEKSKTYMEAVYGEREKNSPYTRPDFGPEGENDIILFKSCYPNSNYKGSPDDVIPSISENLLKGQSNKSEYHTISNAKGIYIDLLEYFKTRQDKLFIVVTAPPVSNGEWAVNARLFNNWLVYEWLKEYSYKNVRVFDFYNIFTSNGGDTETNDEGSETGNHHRYRNGEAQHVVNENCNINRYPSKAGDDHPSPAGNRKATKEFIDLMNIFYNEWRENMLTV